MFLRSVLTNLPRITANYAARSCSHQINPKPTISSTKPSSDWKTIYSFPAINLLAGLSKLKIYQSALTAAGIPLLMVLESLHIVPIQSTELFAALGITGTITLSIYSLCSRNVIGFVYVNPVIKNIRFAYIDFWGKRTNHDITLDELLSSDQKGILNTYTVITTSTTVNSLKLLSVGKVVEPVIFSKIFGDV